MIDVSTVWIVRVENIFMMWKRSRKVQSRIEGEDRAKRVLRGEWRTKGISYEGRLLNNARAIVDNTYHVAY